MTWLDKAKRTPVAEVASALGFALRRTPSSTTCACPACGAPTRHASRGDHRGAVGIAESGPFWWRCHVCLAGGDAADFVAHTLRGARLRDLRGDALRTVAAWFDDRGHGDITVVRPIHPPAQRVPRYPPQAEVTHVWCSAGRCDSDVPVADYLRHRGIDPVAVAELDLARPLARMHGLPRWACLGARTWLSTAHRLLVPLYDHHGVMRSVLARSIEFAPQLKSASPREYERGGLVLANAPGLALLESGVAEGGVLLIREGEIDHLASATVEGGPVLSIVSGSWTAAHAARVPDGTLITIATDNDTAGDRYASAIAASFEGRRVRVARDRRAA